MPLKRVSRKLQQAGAWMNSVRGPADWPAALILVYFRTRPPSGQAPFDRCARRLFPHIWIRPNALRGLRLRLDPARLSHFVIYEEVFIEGAYDFAPLAFEPDVIVDCGAFEGYFSLLAKAHFPWVPVVAFEPNAENFEGLIANVRANRLHVDMRAEAVSTKDGEAWFAGGGCGGHLAGTGEVNSQAGCVKVRDLRQVLTQLAPNRLLLKLDVEGEELGLIPGVLPMLPKQCAVFFEWHHGEDAFAQVVSLLSESGFSVDRKRTMVDEGMTFIDAFAQRA